MNNEAKGGQHGTHITTHPSDTPVESGTVNDGTGDSTFWDPDDLEEDRGISVAEQPQSRNEGRRLERDKGEESSSQEEVEGETRDSGGRWRPCL